MEPVKNAGRRRNRRYIVRGEAAFLLAAENAVAELVNIGPGGMLFRNHVFPPMGTNLTIQFAVCGYPAELRAHGQVVGGNSEVVALRFGGEPPGLNELLEWLEGENYPWTGLDTPVCGCPEESQQDGHSSLSTSAKTREEENEMAAILAYLEGLG
ncbi:MAG: hypothetical protein HY647_01470 [Acidobacteria bacterium]|nr:hypothetical protein [Acidobacteriota bacterium]